ncbi:hypothetical protein V6N13_128030 [Hibiscus sabdariffa]|uniref:RIN4 pathogenic type III effector avirulence factor Avr cleavage site domain-containing protein n=1 Tax=Hibiscus sabdariffa TaxID=183260 RepID=A0ABR1Z978_9ROSI
MQEKGRALPKFGEWDVNNPSSAEGFTVIFNKARNEKKAGGKVNYRKNGCAVYKLMMIEMALMVQQASQAPFQVNQKTVANIFRMHRSYLIAGSSLVYYDLGLGLENTIGFELDVILCCLHLLIISI